MNNTATTYTREILFEKTDLSIGKFLFLKESLYCSATDSKRNNHINEQFIESLASIIGMVLNQNKHGNVNDENYARLFNKSFIFCLREFKNNRLTNFDLDTCYECFLQLIYSGIYNQKNN